MSFITQTIEEGNELQYGDCGASMRTTSFSRGCGIEEEVGGRTTRGGGQSSGDFDYRPGESFVTMRRAAIGGIWTVNVPKLEGQSRPPCLRHDAER